MSSYGPPGPSQPEDPYGQPAQQPGGYPPAPPPGGDQPPAPAPQWGQPSQPDQPQWQPPAQPEQPPWAPPAQPEQPAWAPPQSAPPAQPDQPAWSQPQSGPSATPDQPQWAQPSQPDQPQWGQPPQPDQPQWGQPSQPEQPQWGQPPQSGQPGGPAGGYPPPGYPPATPGQPWGQPPPPGPYGPGVPMGVPGAPPKKNGGRIALIIGLVVVLLVCPCLGFGVWALTRDSDDSNNANDPAVDVPGISTSSRPATEPTKEDAGDESDLDKGDCVVNKGTDDDPTLQKVPCGPHTFEVLSRIPFTTDTKKCDTDPLFGAEDTDTTYVYDSSLDVSDFVLCMKERTK